MKSKIQISIPRPCHENWQDMTVSEKGRFCASCQKNVIDFTKSSDREILKVFKDNGNLCGRFNDSQLDRELFVPKEKNTVWVAVASGVFAFLGIGNHIIHAQSFENTIQTDQKSDSYDKIRESNEIEVKGTITDQSGQKLPGVRIVVKGTDRYAVSDFDGNFYVAVKFGEALNFEYIGFLDKEILIDTNANQNLNVILNEMMLGNPDMVIVRKRTFFGRIFHSIGNLFR